MSKFTDRLWRELVREHGADLRELERRSAGRTRRAPRLLAGTGLIGVAGAGAAVAIALSAAGSSPAFAVTRNHDGSYSVGISQLRAIPLANARLRALGLRARLVQVMRDCSSAPPGVVPGQVVLPQAARPSLSGARIDPAKIPVGRTLMLAAIKQGAIVHLAQAAAVSSVPACLPPPLRICWSAVHGAGAPGGGPLGSATGTGTSTTGPATIGPSTTSTGTSTTPTGASSPAYAVPPKAVPPKDLRCVAPPRVMCAFPPRAAGGTGTTGTSTTGTGTGPSSAPAPPARDRCVGPPPPACALLAKVRAARAAALAAAAPAPAVPSPGPGQQVRPAGPYPPLPPVCGLGPAGATGLTGATAATAATAAAAGRAAVRAASGR